MDRIDLKLDDAVVDLGCGTGAFVIPASRFCREVFAVDVSQAMLDLCRTKAEKQGLENIEYHRAGFLTYEHMAEPVDVVVSSVSLHHLPDFWKAVALKRIHDMLKPGGRFYLFDVVFSFPVENYFEEIEKWLTVMAGESGETMAAESKVHIRDEYSTFEWIMDGMLERAGFDISTKFNDFPCCLAYVCERSE
jgi:ubiquinone/menaquinone biosynthesis C-methylase UbiE